MTRTLLLAAAIGLLAAAISLLAVVILLTHQPVRIGPHKVMAADQACFVEFPRSPEIPDAVTTTNWTNCERFIENEQMEARFRHAEAQTR